jgi:hypothetical protein
MSDKISCSRIYVKFCEIKECNYPAEYQVVREKVDGSKKRFYLCNKHKKSVQRTFKENFEEIKSRSLTLHSNNNRITMDEILFKTSSMAITSGLFAHENWKGFGKNIERNPIKISPVYSPIFELYKNSSKFREGCQVKKIEVWKYLGLKNPDGAKLWDDRIKYVVWEVILPNGKKLAWLIWNDKLIQEIRY